MTASSTDTLSGYLDAAVGPYAPPALVSPAVLGDIEQIAKMLPGALSGFFGFECRLGSSQASADFLVCASADDGGREALAGLWGKRDLPTSFESSAVWNRVRRFAEVWNDPASALFHSVHNFWLEFDTAGPLPTASEPSVFLGSDQLRPELDPSWLIEGALAVLNAGSLGAEAEALIRRCVKRLPPGAKIFQVGRMLGRSSAATRLCARGIPSAGIVDYLRSVDWKGSADDLDALIEGLSEHVHRIDLDFDVDSTVMPKLGLECYPSTEPGRLDKYLAYFASSGYCTPEKAAQLRAWAGMAHQSRTPSIWPRGLQTLSSFLDGRYHSTFVRWLHHIKIVYQPGSPLHAKAYLAVKHLWFSPALLKEILLGARLEDLSLKPGEAGTAMEEKSLC